MLAKLHARANGMGASDRLPPQLVLRAEHSEGAFLRAHAGEFQGVVLRARHVVPSPPGSPPRDAGVVGDELAREVRRLKIDHVHDPDTAELRFLTGNSGDDRRRFGRAAEMPAARWISPGASPDDLLVSEIIAGLTAAVRESQIGVVAPAPAYFEFDSLEDRWLDLNLRLAAAMERVTGNGVALFVQVSCTALERGTLALCAARYAAALRGRGLVFLQVVGLDTEDCAPELLDRYLAAVRTWRAAGFKVVADCVGRFGVAAVAAGAPAMATGTRYYRTRRNVREQRFTRSAKVRYWAPSRGDRLPLDQARKRHAAGRLPGCPVGECNALDEDAKADDVRAHNLHVLAAELGQAVEGPAAFARAWRASPRNYVRAWGSALERALSLSQEA
jgi:hypothetical protein